ncbi:hypothetical protein EVAR_97738_1 [Eumeta japonica]|uniref:Uncharacterized protein n=1 Tax=Eumeta variegata TaxID=151549 RepID=A0A4C1X607_EUMVA|nr:hypothetical protein EVAR_97738_1 [Eumeta japonica]
MTFIFRHPRVSSPFDTVRHALGLFPNQILFRLCAGAPPPPTAPVQHDTRARVLRRGERLAFAVFLMSPLPARGEGNIDGPAAIFYLIDRRSHELLSRNAQLDRNVTLGASSPTCGDVTRPPLCNGPASLRKWRMEYVEGAEGVSHRNSRSLDEIKRQKLLLHICNL